MDNDENKIKGNKFGSKDSKAENQANSKNNKSSENAFSIPETEIEAANFWDEKKVFSRSVERKAKKGNFVFFDGPPFATGTPHYGHLVGSIIKDVIPRFATMRGYSVERKWGWDCHGLPIENIVEKELGMKTKKDIEDLGIDKFNNLCRERVSTYIEEWKTVIRRLGRFVDMENAYRTMDLPFMESVWSAFKTLWDKELIYKNHRSMHICPRCETTLSQSEVSEGYKDIKDLSATAKFKLKAGQKISLEKGGKNGGESEFEIDDKTFILAWTTTPWTLIGNVALAVGEEIDYVLLKVIDVNFENNKYKLGDSLIIAKNRLEKNFGITEERFNEIGMGEYKVNLFDGEVVFNIASIFKGKNLLNLEYEPLYNYYSQDEKLVNRENGWKIYGGDFVTTEEGVGVVHIAPAFGEDDMRLGRENNLPFIQHVGMDGAFKAEVKDFPGLNVKPIENNSATDIEIIKNLAGRGLLFHKEKYEHSYPHCWRCDTPLINYATSSWFVNVNKLKPKLLETAKNINWSPNYLKEGRFGNWLEGARDWSISRQRFWASCIPIWECSCGARKVISSVAELEKLSAKKVDDIHKDKIDDLTFPCADCGGEMRRIPDVLDCWFESGAMPYAQSHYPFENKEKFENNFPADFIAEGVDQTRTWFYYLHILSGAISESEPAKNIVTNGIVLAEDGKKMSKKLKNYPDPALVMEKYGADALRAYLLSSPVVMAENLNFSEKGVQEALRKNVMLLWNVYKFYEMFGDEVNFEKIEKSGKKKGREANKEKDAPINVLDIWVKAKLKVLIKEVSLALDSNAQENKTREINLPKAMRAITEFIDEFSTWYLRRSRDRFKSDNEDDKNQAILTTREVFLNLTKVIAPFMPFIAENLWQKVSGNNFKNDNSVHLEAWPEIVVLTEEEGLILSKMDVAREIVSLGLAERDKAGIKIRQMLGGALIFVKDRDSGLELEREYLNLISEEINLTKIEILLATNGLLKDGEKIKVELNTEITPELKREGIKRELVRSINMIRKDLGLSRDKSAKVFLATDEAEIKEVIELMGEEIKKETISESLEIRGNFEAEEGIEVKEVKINGVLVGIGVGI